MESSFIHHIKLIYMKTNDNNLLKIKQQIHDLVERNMNIIDISY